MLHHLISTHTFFPHQSQITPIYLSLQYSDSIWIYIKLRLCFYFVEHSFDIFFFTYPWVRNSCSLMLGLIWDWLIFRYWNLGCFLVWDRIGVRCLRVLITWLFREKMLNCCCWSCPVRFANKWVCLRLGFIAFLLSRTPHANCFEEEFLEGIIRCGFQPKFAATQ